MYPFRKGRLGTLVALLALVVAAPVAQAQTPALDFTGGTDFSSFDGTDITVGWNFTVNEPIFLTHLGFWDFTPGGPLAQSHQVGLWNDSGSLLTSTTVQPGSPLTDDFRYEPVALLTLSPGQTYFLGAHLYSPFSDRYINNTTTVTTAPQIAFGGSTRSGSSSGFAFPSIDTGTGGGSNGRFGPNFQFEPVPEPTSMALLLTGGVPLAGRLLRRRRNRPEAD